MIEDGYEAFAEVLTLCIELVRQFYDMPRQFRLLGKGVEFADFDNHQSQAQGAADGRLPRAGVRFGGVGTEREHRTR